SSYWHRNFTRSTVALLGGHRLGLVSLGSVAGLAIGRQVLGILLVLGRTATTVVAAALAVARTTLGTITLGGDITLKLLGGLFYRQFFVLYRWHWLFGLALRAPLLAGGRLDLLGGGGTLLTGLADGGSSGAATATAGSAAFCRLGAGLRGSVRLGDHFAWLAFAALGLLAALGSGFVTAATATAAGVTLGAWATVAVVPALTGAIVVAGGLAVRGGCGLLFAGFFRTAVLGKHADQRFDQALDQARLGFLDGLVGGGDRRRCRGGRGRR